MKRREVGPFRDRLKTAVAELAGAIDRGECTPTRIELLALAGLCGEHGLLAEGERVLRWLQLRELEVPEVALRPPSAPS